MFGRILEGVVAMSLQYRLPELVELVELLQLMPLTNITLSHRLGILLLP
jgi:hypothetical protein